MSRVITWVRKLRAEQAGAAMTEYAILIAIIALFWFSITRILGAQISSLFSAVSTSLSAMI